jgi:hypothetical protein
MAHQLATLDRSMELDVREPIFIQLDLIQPISRHGEI